MVKSVQRTRALTPGRRKVAASFRPRFGLCCQFSAEPIVFRTTTATSLLKLPRREQLHKLSTIGMANAESLLKALQFCRARGIGCFRVVSSILPAKTHPQAGYSIEDLPDAELIVATLRRCGTFAQQHDIRTVFHPDQFVVLNSPSESVVKKSIEDLEHHAQLADWIGADVINIHGGGAYGDKADALARFAHNLESLSGRVRSRLTVENDDKVYTPKDLLPLCRATGIPLVYDVHHHRCLPDGLSIEEATSAAIPTWNREPLFHISSPLAGWSGGKPERHHDQIDIRDFPTAWLGMRATVEVEAKAKELAVLKLQAELAGNTAPRHPEPEAALRSILRGSPIGHETRVS